MVNIQDIIKALKNNQIVCVPTDTIYGLVILATKENSIKLAKFKGNVKEKQYTMMVENAKQALNLWEKNALVTSLVEKHFPGDLTIIAKKKNSNEFLGIRIPDNLDIIKIIQEVGPIFATSTNKSSKEPLNDIKSIKSVFPTILVLNGKCSGKKPSTIVKIENHTVTIIRQGDKFL